METYFHLAAIFYFQKIKQFETRGVKLSEPIEVITHTKKKKVRNPWFRDYDEDFYDTNGR